MDSVIVGNEKMDLMVFFKWAFDILYQLMETKLNQENCQWLSC